MHFNTNSLFSCEKLDFFGYSSADFGPCYLVHCTHTKCESVCLCNPSVVKFLKPGPNFIELLQHKILLKQKNPCLHVVKSDYRPRLHSIVMISKQQLNTSHKQCTCNWHDILASNMYKISELFSCLSKFLLEQLYEIGPWFIQIAKAK